jgi:hypothetical protein
MCRSAKGSPIGSTAESWYVNLRGFDPDRTAMTSAEALRGLLDSLDVPAHKVADQP